MLIWVPICLHAMETNDVSPTNELFFIAVHPPVGFLCFLWHCHWVLVLQSSPRIVHKQWWGLPEHRSIPARSHCTCYVTIFSEFPTTPWSVGPTLLLAFTNLVPLAAHFCSLSVQVGTTRTLFSLLHRFQTAQPWLSDCGLCCPWRVLTQKHCLPRVMLQKNPSGLDEECWRPEIRWG